ncbi:MAG: hypothetical protein M9894_22775 [Planctomycetes bacterium]|nr:hypothetical protein [Planctomycetota bacterium]
MRTTTLAAALAALLPLGCAVPGVPEPWTDPDAAAPPPADAPVGDGWAFVAAGWYGDEDDSAPIAPITGPTTVFAGYRGEGEPEREFSVVELERARFRGFSAPASGVPPDGPRVEPLARPVPFQRLSEVPR